MHHEQIIDKDESRKVVAVGLSGFAWWERQRIIYNLVVGLTGVLSMWLMDIPFGEFLIAIVGYAFLANVAYCAGHLLELFDIYYLKGSLSIYQLRWVLFILGVLFSVAITILMVYSYHEMPVMQWQD